MTPPVGMLPISALSWFRFEYREDGSFAVWTLDSYEAIFGMLSEINWSSLSNVLTPKKKVFPSAVTLPLIISSITIEIAHPEACIDFSRSPASETPKIPPIIITKNAQIKVIAGQYSSHLVYASPSGFLQHDDGQQLGHTQQQHKKQNMMRSTIKARKNAPVKIAARLIKSGLVKVEKSLFKGPMMISFLKDKIKITLKGHRIRCSIILHIVHSGR